MNDFRKLLFWNILCSIPAGLVSVALPLYLKELGVDYSGIGIIFGAGAILALIINYLVGAHSDFVGRKPYIFFSAVLDTIYFVMLALSSKIWHFIIASFANSSAGSLSSASTVPYLNEIIPKKKRGYYLGLWSGLSGIFYVLGIFTSGFLIAYLGYRNLFFACAVVSVVCVLLSLTLFEKRRKKLSKASNLLGHMADFKNISFGVKFMFLFYFATMVPSWALSAFGYPLYFKSLGASVAMVGIFVGGLWLTNYLSQMVFGKVADKNDPKIILIITGIFIVPINLILIFVTDIYFAAALMLIQGVIFGFNNVAFMKLQFDTAGKNRGRDLTFMYNGGYAALLVGSILGGTIMMYFGFGGIFLFRAFGFFVCMLMMIYYLGKS